MPTNRFLNRLQAALNERSNWIDPEQNTALRLFAGFYEGSKEFVADLYGRTLVLFDYGKDPLTGENNLEQAQDFYLGKLPWIKCVVRKKRRTADAKFQNGVITYGQEPTTQILENDVIYAIDLLMNQDASFYLDTRNLRSWLTENSTGWHVLNTFAYTGSLGVAALAGKADQVIQTDRNWKFLSLARKSAMLSRFDLGRMKLQKADFFEIVGRLKRAGSLFDCVILDPPFFSKTDKGKIDLVNQSTRMINKIRPLVKDGGLIIAINNALYLSGKDYIKNLELLCLDGYLTIGEIISIPEDITGYPGTIINYPPADPAPFNHPTKIITLNVRRKS